MRPGCLRGGRRSIAAGLAAGTTTGTGTDLFTEMRLALAAERSRANAGAVGRYEAVDAVELNRRDMLRLATLDAARVWHLDHETGSLTPGKEADVTVVDMRPPQLDGFGDPVATLVMGAGAADVETVVVDGEIVKVGGALVAPLAEHARELMRPLPRPLRARAALASLARFTLNSWPTTSRRFVTSGSFSSSSSIFAAWPSSKPSTTRTLAPCSG